LRASRQKGVIFGIALIFLMLINFHIMAATMISKLMGTNVLRGAIPEVRFMTYFLILYGIWVGWSATSKVEKSGTKVLQGLVAGVTMGVVVALFDLILVFLVQTNTDIRRYLSNLSFDNINIFLQGFGATGIFVHMAMFVLAGILGSVLAIVVQSKTVADSAKAMKSSISQMNRQISERLPEKVKKYGKYLFYLVILGLLLMLPSRWGSYYNFVFGLVGLYVIAGIGLNIMLGLSGQFVIGLAAFFAMGAYSVALLNAPKPHGLMWGFWPALLIGMLVAVIAAILLGLPTTRLRGDYLGIVTLGFGEIIRILLKSDLLTSFSGGPRGIQDIKGPTLMGKPFTDVTYMYLIIICMAVSIFLYYRLEKSRTGRAWLAIKEDLIVAQATGINIMKYRLLALCIGAAFAGLAGGIFAARNQFTGPNDHTLMVSINILSLIIVGGMNSIPGILLGSFALKGLPEILREMENYRLLVFGALLVVMMLVRPEGLWPASRPNLEQEAKEKLFTDGTSEKGGQDA
jgi:ABC-type branched-subunit amino acid transport system permease subunit